MKTARPLETSLSAFKKGDIEEAEQNLSAFIEAKFDLPVHNLKVRKDTLSLNSVNGVFDSGSRKLFFKFHMEESESTVQEYYRAELLSNAGYPVEQPLYISRAVGEQVLIYPFKESERLADVCRRLDKEGDISAVVKAQEELDRICAGKALETYRVANPTDLEKESILQLFYWRLVDVAKDGFVTAGGRYKNFYVGQDFIFPNDVKVSYESLSALHWVINGKTYPVILEEAFVKARKILAPDHYAEYAACTAHGDAHNGNAWLNKINNGTNISWFDPAFAGENIPVLLAEVKTLFHNIFAHPDWLYDSKDANNALEASCKIEDGKIVVEHKWELTPLRSAFLRSKLENFWKPVLKELQSKGQLPLDWEEYVRSALFCCPTLVMNLRADAGSSQNSHTPKTSLVGLSIAIMLASAADKPDIMSDFFTDLRKFLK